MATERAQKILEKWDQEKNAIERAETKSSIDDQKKIQVKIEPELDYMQQALDHKLKYGAPWLMRCDGLKETILINCESTSKNTTHKCKEIKKGANQWSR